VRQVEQSRQIDAQKKRIWRAIGIKLHSVAKEHAANLRRLDTR
jgi:hypothetical protein